MCVCALIITILSQSQGCPEGYVLLLYLLFANSDHGKTVWGQLCQLPGRTAISRNGKTWQIYMKPFLTTVPFRPTVQSRVTICPELNTSGVLSQVTGHREQLPKQVNRKYDFCTHFERPFMNYLVCTNCYRSAILPYSCFAARWT